MIKSHLAVGSKRRVYKQSVIHLCDLNTLVHDIALMYPTLAIKRHRIVSKLQK